MRHLIQPTLPATLCPEVLSVLQLCVINEPLFPNLKTLLLWRLNVESVPFIPLFLSPRTTVVSFGKFASGIPKAMIASMITTLQTQCPNLQEIFLSLSRDPMVVAAVSGMVLTNNQNTLQRFHVDCPLTEEAHEIICKLPNLRDLSMVIGSDTPLPPLVLPSLTTLNVTYDDGSAWLQGFRGATLGKLVSVEITTDSNSIGGFLEVLESVALTTSVSATLSTFMFHTSQRWRPNYRSLLPFTQLRELAIDFSCDRGCSSTIDDDTIIDMARTMPKLKLLHLGGTPCRTPTGVTAKGLAALSHYCPHLFDLRVHFQADSLDPRPASIITSDDNPIIPRVDCALKRLQVGEIPVTEESALMVALTLLRIFPRLDFIVYSDEGWEEVAETIALSKQLVDASSKKFSLIPSRGDVNDTSHRSHIPGYCLIEKS